jgi:hypothetical protein
MAVVINEFEVIPGEAPRKQDDPAPSAGYQTEVKLDQQQIEQMLERQRERCERIWAH